MGAARAGRSCRPTPTATSSGELDDHVLAGCVARQLTVEHVPPLELRGVLDVAPVSLVEVVLDQLTAGDELPGRHSQRVGALRLQVRLGEDADRALAVADGHL